MCPREKLTRPVVTMGMKHFRNLVTQAKDLGAELISPFGYGEPLMDKTIAEKIQFCTDLELDTFITSNGGLMTVQKAHDLLHAGLKHIRFSVHGFGANYETVHRKLSFRDTLVNIVNFLKVNDVKFYHSCTVDITAIPMHNEPIEDFINFWKPSLGKDVDHLEIWKPHNWTNGRGYRGVVPKKKTCGRPFNGPVQIQADGKMIVCCFDYDGALEVGDTYKDKIKDILKSHEFNLVRMAHRTGKLHHYICAECDQLNIETENPLLYSTVDKSCEIGVTSSAKIKLKEK